jgi:hypothetical protein
MGRPPKLTPQQAAEARRRRAEGATLKELAKSYNVGVAVGRDGFLPRAFAVPGRRLVYWVGILFLTLGSGALLAAFDGITDRLIPLFAIGAFLSFTLSQAGMAAHWWRSLRHDGQPSPRWRDSALAGRAKLFINGGGAVATGFALAIILVAKFAEGAWLTVIVIPCTLLLLKATRRYYHDVDRQLLPGSHRRIDLHDHRPPAVLVPIQRWDRVSRKAVQYALRPSDNVTGLHVSQLEGPDAIEHDDRLQREWSEFVERPAREAGLHSPRLSIVRSQFRSVVAPLLREIEETDRRFPDRPIFVVLPEIVEGRWWGYLLHTHRERRLRARLLRHGGSNLAVIGVPWQLEPSDPEQVLAEEEPAD